MVKLSELQIKEIIVIDDGTRLGHFSDLEIDAETGKIISLILSVKDKQGGFFGKSDEMIIHWNQIETIGSDVILVKNVQTPSLYPDQHFIE
ncbi:YlmC/YmxH family sporulation protein [Virgibacillus sp. FSP13]